MSDTAASFDDVTFFGGREFALGDVRGPLGRVVGVAAMGVAAVAAVGASAATVAVAGLWMVGVTLSDAPHLTAHRPAGPARLALADPAAFPTSSFEAKWALTTAVMPVSARIAAQSAAATVAEVGRDSLAPTIVSHPQLKVVEEAPKAPPPTRVVTQVPVGVLAHVAEPPPADATAAPAVRVAARTPTAPVVDDSAPVPLPRPKPRLAATADAPVAPAAPRVAALALAPPEHKPTPPALIAPHGRTALYDISGHTVYLPNGKRLEAHSGLGHRRDNPRYVKLKNRGPTPPNVYELTLRKRLFHGVRAVRMTPVDENKMFGRDGMLAHSYMLGSSGQSNGCVSFKHYDRFLQAFLKGEVDRMVVVRHLDDVPQHLASLTRARDDDKNRYAANEITGSTW